MKLLSLSSTNPKFKTITFKNGLNIVAGIQLSDSDKKTYNGVGKSFSLSLLHYLFGGSFKTQNQGDKKILEFLKSYGTFTLDFEVSGKPHRIDKNFKDSHYYIDNKKVVKTNVKAELTKLVVGSKVLPNISFKNVFNSFARRYGGSFYTEASQQQGMPNTDFHQNLVNFWLLGLDTDLVLEKKRINERLKKLIDFRKEIESFENTIENSNIKDLKDELRKVKSERDAFVIAENYDQFEAKADALTEKINSIRTEKQRLTSSLSTKSEALRQAKAVDIDLNKVAKIYNEAEFFFKEDIKQRLEEAKDFHVNLMTNRVKRFRSEIEELNERIAILESEITPLEKSRDLILKDLSSKGALDEFNSINERIKTIEGQISDLDKYSKLIESFKEDEASLELESAKLKIEATEYLAGASTHLDKVENMYRSLVKRFYENHGGSLQVTLAKDAKYLYDLDIHVPRDKSQGVNEVKIFCYDLLLYQLNPELLGFVAHDGCIFSEMDPRQKSTIFKVALELINKSGLQYFINIGQASLEEVLDDSNKLNVLTKNEKQQIEESIRLKLFDKDPESWLLGYNFG